MKIIGEVRQWERARERGIPWERAQGTAIGDINRSNCKRATFKEMSGIKTNGLLKVEKGSVPILHLNNFGHRLVFATNVICISQSVVYKLNNNLHRSVVSETNDFPNVSLKPLLQLI